MLRIAIRGCGEFSKTRTCPIPRQTLAFARAATTALGIRKHDSGPHNARGAPSPNGRTAKGRFAKGNLGGPGNPHGSQVAKLRAALLDAVSIEDIEAVARTLVAQARAGEIQAARELLNRVMGKAPDDSDRGQPMVLRVITGVPERQRAR